jgi:hypothetical protein
LELSSTFAAEEVKFEGKDSFHYQMLKEGAWPRKNQRFWQDIDSMMDQDALLWSSQAASHL